MVWLVVAAVVVVGALALGAGVWLLLPTLRTFRGPAFEPTYTDDEEVLQVQQSYINTAGGAGG